MLSKSIEDDEIHIEGLSNKIFCGDHPSGDKVGGVCLYFKENLPIKRLKDLEILQETVISEISLGSKQIFFTLPLTKLKMNLIYFTKNYNIYLTVKDEKPHCIILTGDLNCRSTQW